MNETTQVPESTALSMEEQERKLGEMAKAEYIAAGQKKLAALKEIEEWDKFFASHGVNPQVQIDRLIASANSAEEANVDAQTVHATRIATKSNAIELGPEHNFVINYAESRSENGFTLEEIVKVAVTEKVISQDTKEDRKQFYDVVIGLKKSGVLVTADLKRDGNTVFCLPK